MLYVYVIVCVTYNNISCICIYTRVTSGAVLKTLLSPATTVTGAKSCSEDPAVQVTTTLFSQLLWCMTNDSLSRCASLNKVFDLVTSASLLVAKCIATTN